MGYSVPLLVTHSGRVTTQLWNTLKNKSFDQHGTAKSKSQKAVTALGKLPDLFDPFFVPLPNLSERLIHE